MLDWISLLQRLTTLAAFDVHAIGTALNATPIPNNTCCQALSVIFPEQIHYPSDVSYAQSESSYWAPQAREVQPACIFQPTSTKNVSAAVSVLATAKHAKYFGCQFAIRSGGHTPWAGAANQQDGVTIDMSNMNSVTVNTAANTVSVGPGNRWVDIYTYLEQLGLSTSGGRDASVGVGGLTLGGGISYYSGRKGFVCNNAINFELVTGTGAILNVNQNTFPDLLVALRGGSNNFGIVTKIDMITFKQGNFWGGQVVNPISVMDQTFAAFISFLTNPDYDPYSALINSFAWSAATGWIISNDIKYTADSPPNTSPAVFQNFTSFPCLYDTLRVSNLSGFTTELDSESPYGPRQTFITSTYSASETMLSSLFDIANQTVATIADVEGLGFSISFQPLSTTLLAHAGDNGGNSLGINVSTGNIFNTLLTARWINAADDLRVEAASHQMFAQAEAIAKKLGVFQPFLYLNYADKTQDPISSYGLASVSKLKAASKKYDPLQIFQNQVPGGFKLP